MQLLENDKGAAMKHIKLKNGQVIPVQRVLLSVRQTKTHTSNFFRGNRVQTELSDYQKEQLIKQFRHRELVSSVVKKRFNHFRIDRLNLVLSQNELQASRLAKLCLSSEPSSPFAVKTNIF